ncbi:lipopolysaccharide biosynthesis protein [Mucilaginibacter hurinus]|uniref:Lipopolysaccharide biosynthesis protein n=1 Tax=Mucilaginibacter hurinus TaxID=2201324 RepID=A0A367GT68_9SPHI|nr:lipopolysaccharide biosynthesis protein [Mucilaginibacter hurinus]RCH55903.1 lipopolysaccharide biosynthesis protein [Mucilaginibacter hurinus]
MTQNEQEKTTTNSSEYTVEELLEKTKSYLRYLKKHRIKTLIYGLIFGLIGLGLSFKKAPKYTAKMTFLVHEETKPGGLSGLASQFGLGGGAGGGKEIWSGFNMVPFLTSRLMVQKTLFTTAQFKDGPELLLNHYIKFYEYDKKWAKSKKLKHIKFTSDKNLTRAHDSILNVFYHQISDKNLTLDRWDKKSTIVLLSFTDKDELFAKNFVEALVANAMEYYVTVKTKKAASNVNKLSMQADSIKRKLDIAMSSVAYSADATPNPNPMRKSLRVNSERRMVDVELYSRSLVEISKSLELAKVSLTQDTPLIDFLDKPVLPLEVKKLSKPLAVILGFIFGVGLSISILTFRKIAGKA